MHRWLASWGVQADTVVLQMLLLETAQVVRRLGKNEAWNLLLTCWQVVAIVPPGGQRRSVHRRSRAEDVCFGLDCSALLILGLLAVPDLRKQLRQLLVDACSQLRCGARVIMNSYLS